MVLKFNNAASFTATFMAYKAVFFEVLFMNCLFVASETTLASKLLVASSTLISLH